MMGETTFERKLWGQIEKNQKEIDRKDCCCDHTWISFSNDQILEISKICYACE